MSDADEPEVYDGTDPAVMMVACAHCGQVVRVARSWDVVRCPSCYGLISADDDPPADEGDNP